MLSVFGKRDEICLRYLYIKVAAIQQITVDDIVWLGGGGLSGAISAWTVIGRSKQSPPAKMIDGQYN